MGEPDPLGPNLLRPLSSPKAASLSPGKRRERLGQDLINRPLEPDRKCRQFRQWNPAPGVEFRVRVVVQPDLASLAQEPHREPALPLAAVLAAPGDPQQV